MFIYISIYLYRYISIWQFAKTLWPALQTFRSLCSLARCSLDLTAQPPAPCAAARGFPASDPSAGAGSCPTRPKCRHRMRCFLEERTYEETKCGTEERSCICLLLSLAHSAQEPYN